ncbi:hypothetical protein T484DRAFT_1856115 [Baffinella frigidus]|nr:hypothetical protein T484DRAFT_1856115 [Cryptophyta sp. CCMP2293]
MDAPQICAKLKGLSRREYMLVVGPESRIGDTAREHLLQARLRRHPDPALKEARCTFERVEAACIRVNEDPYSHQPLVDEVTMEMLAARSEILGERTQVFLCTIASTSRLLKLWEEHFGKLHPLNIHTVIVDECGCTTESSVALLL